MKNHAPRQIYDGLLTSMPAGVERSTLRVLSFHVGQKNAITRPDLLAALSTSGFTVGDRQMRVTITDLRKAGHLICSSSGDGGYYIAETVDEYREFARVEYESKITDMAETLRAMDEGARKVFAHADERATQTALF